MCGLILHRMKAQTAEAWLAFACDRHAVGLVAPRVLLDRDRVVLQRWRAETARAQAGQPWQRPTPLSRGADAVELVARARRWAERTAAAEPTPETTKRPPS